MKIGLVLDNPKRDLYGLLLVAYHLIKLRHEVVVIPMYLQGYDIPLLGIDVVLLNYARPNNLELIKTYSALGIRVVVLDTEGGVLSESGSDSPDRWAHSVREYGVTEYIDAYCFWGEKVYSSFLKYSGIAKEKLYLTGCPRFDIFHPKWKRLFGESLSSYVLVNTNFSAVNPLFTKDSEAEYKIFLSAGWDAEYIRRVIDELSDLFPRFVAEVKYIVANNPEKKFVIRPHPFEDPDYYRKEFVGIPNVCIEEKNNIAEAVLGAECIIHLNCGSAVEAYMAGALPVSLEYLNTKFLRQHTPLPSMVSYEARKRKHMELLFEDLDEVSRAHFRKRLYERHIEPWFFKSDGGASERVAAVLDGIKVKGLRSSSLSIKAGVSSPRAGQLVQGVASYFLGSWLVSHMRRRLTPNRSGKFIGRMQLKTIFDKFSQYDKVIAGVQIAHARHPISRVPLSSFLIVL